MYKKRESWKGLLRRAQRDTQIVRLHITNGTTSATEKFREACGIALVARFALLPMRSRRWREDAPCGRGRTSLHYYECHVGNGKVSRSLRHRTGSKVRVASDAFFRCVLPMRSRRWREDAPCGRGRTHRPCVPTLPMVPRRRPKSSKDPCHAMALFDEVWQTFVQKSMSCNGTIRRGVADICSKIHVMQRRCSARRADNLKKILACA